MDDHLDADLGAVGSLTDPTRRRLYVFVTRSNEPVGRDEAADALGIPRETAAYHLDRLPRRVSSMSSSFDAVVERLPEQGARRSSTRGPSVITRCHCPAPVRARCPHSPRGGFVGIDQAKGPCRGSAPDRHRVGGGGLDQALRDTGYDPVMEEGEIRFRNCPFHALKTQDQRTVCNLNLGLVEGMLEGSDDGRSAYLEPSETYCCVRVRPEA